MSEIIKSITEAFSKQPRHYEICQRKSDANPFDELVAHVHHEFCIKEITDDFKQVDSKTGCKTYVGYDFSGKKKFEFLQASVNVIYF